MFSPKRLRERREALGITQAELARSIGISRASYFNWEQGKTKPNQANLQLLSDYLKVEPAYFDHAYDITVIYDQLYVPNQERFMHYGKSLLASQQAEASPDLYVYRVYEKLSAGSGYGYFDDRSYDAVYYEESLDHDFASWVYGDSMEPAYQNGAVVLIKDTGFDYDGEVYAVDWDGQTYLKRVYRQPEGLRLVSINKKYQDKLAPYEEEPRIIGKAVGTFMPKERFND